MKQIPPGRRDDGWATRDIVFILLLCALCGVSPMAQGAVAGAGRLESTRASEQFVVHDTRQYGRSLSAYSSSENLEMVQLEPGTLLLSAERVRDALTRQLRIPARGGGQIHCFLYAPVRNDENIVIASTLHTDGWKYRMQIPDDLKREKLVRGLVQVLLLEIANRGTAQKSAEIPSWLLEGLTRQVMADVGPEVILNSVPPNALRRSMREIKGAGTLSEARAYFRTRRPLSFAELSEPLLAALPEEQMRRHQLSAQLLVSQLCEMPGGHARLMTMIRNLPNCWNWQTAFLHAFQFERLLDAEKWWFVATSTFQGRDMAGYSSTRMALESLEGILTTPAHLRLDTNAVPVRIEATLTQVISDWDYPLQRTVLQQKLAQMALLRSGSTAEVALLLDGYMACLQGYLQKRDRFGRNPNSKRDIVPPPNLLVQDAAQQLRLLDRQRLALRQQIAATAGTTAVPPP